MPRRLLKTIGFRLTLWNTIVVLIVSLFAMFAVRETVRVTLENEAKALLREEAIELELAIKQLHPDQQRIEDEFNRKVLGHSLHGWFASLLNEDSVAIWESDNFPQDGVSTSFENTPTTQVEYLRTDDQLIVKHPFVMSDRTQRTIVIGEPTEFIKNDIWQLTQIILAIGGVMLVIAPLIGYLLSARAISPVRQIISTTRKLNPEHLDSRLPIRGSGDELDQISGEINLFVDQIARYIDNQRVFVADAAHELRSPITAIQTSVDVTLNQPRTSEEYKDQLETVSEQCQQLRYLVNQLLQLAESDSPQNCSPSTPVDLTALIQQSVAVFSGVAEERNIRIVEKIQPDVAVFGDPLKLRQVINNLIDNALKFSPEHSEVCVSLTTDPNSISIVVQDSGGGVATEYLTRIFDRFFQIDPARQRDRQRGNGLGLSICKSIVERHHGSIIAENRSSGFAVRIQLPQR